MSDKFVCAHCGYLATNNTISRELKSPFREMITCPECGNTEIIPEKRYAYKWGWKIIRESGSDKKIQDIPGAFLQLGTIGEEPSKESMTNTDLPKHVEKEFDEKSEAVNRILKESNILEKLTKLGVNLHCNITVFDSK